MCQGGKRVIFTIITVIIRKRKRLIEKLHLVPSRRFDIREIKYNNISFFLTRLNSFCEDNKKAIEKFKEKSIVQTIDNNSKIVNSYKYALTINCIFRVFESKKDLSIVVFDKKGEIIHLLPKILSRCSAVYVSTEKEEEYASANEKILKSIGNSAVICSEFCSVSKIDAVICTDETYFTNAAVFGENHYFAAGEIEELSVLKALLREDESIFAVAAGLTFVNGEKALLDATATAMQYKEKMYSIEEIKNKFY